MVLLTKWGGILLPRKAGSEMDSPKVYNLADKSLYTKALSKLYNNLVASQLGKIVKIIC